MNKNSPAVKSHRKRNVILVIILVLIAARIALPYMVLHFANKTLSELPTLYGHIDDIDIALYRGAYKIKDIYINKKDSVTESKPSFSALRLLTFLFTGVPYFMESLPVSWS